jgi:transposase
MKITVDRVQRGRTRIVNVRFIAIYGHYLFEPDFCNVTSGWEKGIVEKNVQEGRRQVWAELRDQRCSLEQVMKRSVSGTDHPGTPRLIRNGRR